MRRGEIRKDSQDSQDSHRGRMTPCTPECRGESTGESCCRRFRRPTCAGAWSRATSSAYLEDAILEELARADSAGLYAAAAWLARGIPLDALGGWYRRLCLDYHPDRGGSTEAMQALNEGTGTFAAARRGTSSSDRPRYLVTLISEPNDRVPAHVRLKALPQRQRCRAYGLRCVDVAEQKPDPKPPQSNEAGGVDRTESLSDPAARSRRLGGFRSFPAWPNLAAAGRGHLRLTREE